MAADTADTPPRAAGAWLWATGALTAGAFVAAVAMAPPASAAPVRALSWLLFLGASVHVAATGWLFTLREVRGQVRAQRGRYLWAPASLILVTGMVAAVAPPAALAWFLLPYFGWQFFHYQKQNVGMAALAASSHRVRSLRPAERRAVMLAGYAGIAGLMCRPGLLQLRVDPGLGALFPVAGCAFAAAVGTGLVMLARRPAGARPAGFCVLYLISLAFSFPVFVFSSPYAAVGGMTIAHGLQYLLLVGLVTGGGAGEGQRAGSVLRVAAFCNVALIGGVILNVASHLHDAAPAARFLFGMFLGAVMAHFVIDAGLWRLRDSFPRAFLAGRLPYLVPASAAGRSPGSPLADRSSADIR